MMAEAEAPGAGSPDSPADEVTEAVSSSEPEAASDPQPAPANTEGTSAAARPPPGPNTGAERAAAASGEGDTTAENAADGSADCPADLTGKWHLARNEHFDEFMKASGIGYLKRKLINSLHPTIDIERSGDEYTFTSKTPMGHRVTSFTVGVEYPETNPLWGDKEHRVMPEWQGSKLVQRVVHGPDDGVPRSFEREVVNGELVITMRRGDDSCKRFFKRV